MSFENNNPVAKTTMEKSELIKTTDTTPSTILGKKR